MTRLFRRDEDVLGDPGGRGVRARFEPVESSEALADVLDSNATGTTLLFLHDPFCPISTHAFEEVEQVDTVVRLLDVSRHSRLGREVESRTGIRHESPQAILLKDGVPAWHASHGRIRADAVRAALARDTD